MATEMKNLIGKLNPLCKKAIESAASLCVQKTNYNVEIEHFVLKLLEQHDSDIQLLLRHYEIDAEAVKRHLQGAIDKFTTGCTSSPVLSQNILLLLEHAWGVTSLKVNQGMIRSATILLALVDVEQIRGIVLESCPLILRIPRHSFREDIHEILRVSPENRYIGMSQPGQPHGEPLSLETPLHVQGESLKKYAHNLNEAAKQGRLDPVCGREVEVHQLIDILSRRKQNNPILVGDAGVGKTAIVEGLVQQIVRGDVPTSLQNTTIYSLDLGLLQAGAGMKGEFEDRLKSVLEEMNAAITPAILFIDEAHTLIGAGGTAGTGDAANLLKPALARGELRIIAATTWPEYKRYIEADAALTRRFELVKVAEPTTEVGGMILRQLVATLEKHHHVEILSEAIDAAVSLSQRFLPHRRLPDKAINLLDTTCARVALTRRAKPMAIESLENRKTLLEIELTMLNRERVRGKSHSLRQEQIQAELREIDEQVAELLTQWGRAKEMLSRMEELQNQPSLLPDKEQKSADKELGGLQEEAEKIITLLGGSLSVDRRAVAQVLSSWTGVPLQTMLSHQDGLTFDDVFEKLRCKVVGQDSALERIAQNIISYNAGIADPNKPMGVFLLVGPSGVGKTETAQVLAEVLTGSVGNLIRINLSEFQEAHTVATLKGSPPGYVGYGKGGVLTEAVRRNPYSVILLDEIERAHPDVMNLFYQVFDKGVMEDGEGIEINFKNCLIVMTSNIGAESINSLWEEGNCPSIDAFYTAVEPKVWENLSQRFNQAFLSRTTVIPYLPLGFGELAQITKLKLSEIDERLRYQHHTELVVLEKDINRIIEISQGLQSGARAIDRVLSSQVLPRLSEHLLHHRHEESGLGEVRLEDMGI